MPNGQPQPTSDDQLKGKATASLILGIIGMLTWTIPIIGIPVQIVGLTLSGKGKKSSAKGMATAGFILCIIGLALSAAAIIYWLFLLFAGF